MHRQLLLPSRFTDIFRSYGTTLVFSPNHEEAGTFFGEAIEEQESEAKPQKIQELADRYLDLGLQTTCIIRSGKLGAYVKQSEAYARDEQTRRGIWIPAFYQNSNKVVDVTGAGNAFLGGLIAGLYLENEDVRQACLYGSVSSSYVIEQYGLPRRQENGQWNNEDKPTDRLQAMRTRLRM